jgi:hypothetical protein
MRTILFIRHRRMPSNPPLGPKGCLERCGRSSQEIHQGKTDIRVAELETQPDGSVGNDALSVHEQLRHFSH